MWIKEMGATVITADNEATTCFLQGGTCIDYVVAAPQVAPYVMSVERILEVPWSPHCGLKIRMALRPKAVLVRSLITLRTLRKRG